MGGRLCGKSREGLRKKEEAVSDGKKREGKTERRERGRERGFKEVSNREKEQDTKKERDIRMKKIR